MYNGAPTSPITGVPGWESILEQETLASYASMVPENGVIVEIGAEFGMSASLFCKMAKKSVQIWSVDLFPKDLMYVHQFILAQAGFTRSKQIKGDSAVVGKAWSLGSIDLLFIDGDHTYEGVLRDIDAWIPHVKSGGVIIFHDAAPPTNADPHYLHHEVQRAIDEWLVRNSVDSSDPHVFVEQQSADTMRIFIKER